MAPRTQAYVQLAQKLDEVRASSIEALTRGLSRKDYHYQRGILEGLRQVIAICEEIEKSND